MHDSKNASIRSRSEKRSPLSPVEVFALHGADVFQDYQGISFLNSRLMADTEANQLPFLVKGAGDQLPGHFLQRFVHRHVGMGDQEHASASTQVRLDGLGDSLGFACAWWAQITASDLEKEFLIAFS